jgi:hypothetical protein
MWIAMVYHEMGHYLFWTDAERKADAFALRMVRGLRRPERRTLRLRVSGRMARRTASTPRASASPRRAGSSMRRVSPPTRRARAKSRQSR